MKYKIINEKLYRLIVSVFVLVFVAAIATFVLLTERGEYAQNSISYDYDRPRATPEERFFAAIERILEESPVVKEEPTCALTQADFLYDFDYLLTAIEENFPSLGIIYNRNGVDLLQKGHELRNRLASGLNEICFETFWVALREEFFKYAFPVGHLALVCDNRRLNLLQSYTITHRGNPNFTLARSVLRNPPTHPSFVNLSATSLTLAGYLPEHGQNVIETKIIEEDRIAYLGVFSLYSSLSHLDERTLRTFFNDIGNFDHLILDIRGSRGNTTSAFDSVMGFVINRPLTSRNFHFFNGGRLNEKFFRSINPNVRTIGIPFDVSNMERTFTGRYFSEEVLNDLARFDYRLTEFFTVNPNPSALRSSFDGKIWLLVDRFSYSGAQQVATFYSDIDFVTLVGETTGGMASGIEWHFNYIVLPNTGIIVSFDPTFITDSRGRPLEYGTEPDIFNRPGLCALETVLEIIEEEHPPRVRSRIVIEEDVTEANFEFTQADFLYDFDFLLTAIEENFPTLNIIYRRNGIDLLQKGRELRDRLANYSNELCFESFWITLREEFFRYAFPVGHLTLVCDRNRLRLINAYQQYYRGNQIFGFALNILNNPPLHPGYVNLGATSFTLIDYFPEHRTYMIDTKIIEEGRIAYIGIFTLFRFLTGYEEEQVVSFFNEIGNFEHLIFDIRGNTGGSPSVFDWFMSFVIDEPLNAYNHHFFASGDINVEFFQAISAKERNRVAPFNMNDVSNIFPDLSDEILNDLSQFDYHLTEVFRVLPHHEVHRSAFDGKIWLLVDRFNYSGAQQVATFYSDIDFVTLVGETTGGMASGIEWHFNYIVLPNTGIMVSFDPTFVTDSRGRPLEYGTEPDIFNRPGLCALETVLEMIEENNKGHW